MKLEYVNFSFSCFENLSVRKGKSIIELKARGVAIYENTFFRFLLQTNYMVVDKDLGIILKITTTKKTKKSVVTYLIRASDKSKSLSQEQYATYVSGSFCN